MYDQHQYKTNEIHRSQQGFSLLEVLFAIVLSLIGFSAVFSMQSTQMQSNIHARELSAASNLAERVLSQLHTESFMWTAATLPPPHLNKTQSEWHSFNDFAVDHNLQAHVSEDDQGTILKRQRFCVHYWIEKMSGLYDGLLNTRVRVVWPRNPLDQESIQSICGEQQVANFVDSPQHWFSMTIPAVLRRHPL
jgi:prepilin-type N-terminal cleavage/methylation domain-containing protein